jgi:hypothetical protein
MSSQSESASASDEDFDVASSDDDAGETKSREKLSRSLQKLQAKEKSLRHILAMIEGEKAAPFVAVQPNSTAAIDTAETKETPRSLESASYNQLSQEITLYYL